MDMGHTFNGCNSLTDLKFGEKFNTKNVTKMGYMFSKCSSFPEDIKNKNVEEIIAYFKKNK